MECYLSNFAGGWPSHFISYPCTLVGWLIDNELVLIIGVILVGHIGMDRAFGYGLKYPTAFKDTHFNRV
ncbi:MAG: hypothetical protein COA73_09390 [Candidatus Hydrogenedentota bacterium]|nr:MAG: hypothetical protein COA73_09390 [Candidatus Hydrogenedentota bacterium]